MILLPLMELSFLVKQLKITPSSQVCQKNSFPHFSTFSTSFLIPGQIQQLTFVPNPEAAYELCKQFVPDCDQPLPKQQQQQQQQQHYKDTSKKDPKFQQHDDSMAGYRGMDEDELMTREGLSPREYLEFTETERVQTLTAPEPEMTFVSTPGEPGPRGMPGAPGPPGDSGPKARLFFYNII